MSLPKNSSHISRNGVMRRSSSEQPAAGSYSTSRTFPFSPLIICVPPTNMLDIISFYGINLNQNVVLQQIGFDGSSGTPWEKLFKISTGNLIITALGFVPGYYASVLCIEWLGRKWIQIQGFLMAALFRTSNGVFCGETSRFFFEILIFGCWL